MDLTLETINGLFFKQIKELSIKAAKENR